MSLTQYLMQLQQSLLTLRSCYLRVQSKASHEASETSVHKLLRSWCVVREPELHLYMYVEHDLLARRRDGRVVRESVLRRCTYAVHELVLRHDERDLALHHRGEHVVHELEIHLYMNVVDDLMVHRHDGRVVRA